MFSSSQLYKKWFRTTVQLEDNHEAQAQVNDFVEKCFKRIYAYCCSNPTGSRLIKRDYETVPEFLNLKQVLRELKATIEREPITKGYVQAYLTSGRILNWAIDNEKNRI